MLAKLVLSCQGYGVFFFFSLPKSCFLWDVCTWNVWEIPPEQSWSENGLMSLIRDMENTFDFWDRHPFIFPLWNLNVSQYTDISFLRESIFLHEEIHSALGSLSAPVPCYSWWQWWALPSVSPSMGLLNVSLWLPRVVGLWKVVKITLNVSEERAWEEAEWNRLVPARKRFV